MFTDRLAAVLGRATKSGADADQHAAVVELLLVTVLADQTVSEEELQGLDTFDREHQDWDEGPFSVTQYVGPALAKVRAAMESPGGVDDLIREAAARIREPGLRSATPEYCEQLAYLDGPAPAEQTVLAKIRSQLS